MLYRNQHLPLKDDEILLLISYECFCSDEPVREIIDGELANLAKELKVRESDMGSFIETMKDSRLIRVNINNTNWTYYAINMSDFYDFLSSIKDYFLQT